MTLQFSPKHAGSVARGIRCRLPGLGLAFGIVAATLGLAACGSLIPERPDAPRTFDFGPLPRIDAQGGEPPIALAAVHAPVWLGDSSIHYRLLYRQPGALLAYANSVWVAPPAELLEQRLRQRLAALPPLSGIALQRRLRVELLSFEQVFEQPDQAIVLVQAVATLSGDDAAARRVFTLQRDSDADVHGATRELPVVAERLVGEIVEWASELVRPD